jgi:hypothetical protein
MNSEVLLAGVAHSIAEKSGFRVVTTGFQFLSIDIN